jgi:hypothetical protein
MPSLTYALPLGTPQMRSVFVSFSVKNEDARIEQLVLRLETTAPAVGQDEVGVGIGLVWILVEILHVRVCRRTVEVEVILLDVLAVVALAVGEPEEALLEDRVDPVPECQRAAEALPVIGNAGKAVLAPAVGPRAGLVVAEVIPGVAAVAVVFAHGAPLALAQIRAPAAPRDSLLVRFFKSVMFGSHGCVCEIQLNRGALSAHQRSAILRSHSAVAAHSASASASAVTSG